MGVVCCQAARSPNRRLSSGVAAPLRMVMDFPLFDAIGPDTDDDPRRKLVRVIDRCVAGGAQYQQVAILQVGIVDCNDFAVGRKRSKGRRYCAGPPG